MPRPSVLIPLPPGSRAVPSYVLAVSLAANTAESFTVPTLNAVIARCVIFSSNVDFFVNCYTTATVPGDVTDGTASELNPSSYQLLNDVATISVISASAGIVTAAFYS